MPSWPLLFWPQHLIDSPDIDAQEWNEPNAMDVAVREVNPATVTGDTDGVIEIVPIPNCPKLLEPQHLTDPSESTAHVW